ncbi:MAG: hypothetical protein DRQ35_06580 [Gammaproteobacteria bacterium]|nr:MAG: hypothetical protein DRQ35_06580 [Gammaproteobacteria bacterium]
MSDPRQYSFIKFDYTDLPKEYHGGYPFSKKHRYIYMGEIPNMGGHCIVMDDDGKMYVGYHTDNFVELTDDEMDEFWPVGYNPK